MRESDAECVRLDRSASLIILLTYSFIEAKMGFTSKNDNGDHASCMQCISYVYATNY